MSGFLLVSAIEYTKNRVNSASFMISENIYRTVFCGDLNEAYIGKDVRAAGWVENIRDHGGVMFLDIRDHYGVVQVVVHDDSILASLNRETTVSVRGKVLKRADDTVNMKISTGTVEIHIDELIVLGKCNNSLPFEIITSVNTSEEVRLKYRFLDLRNPKLHQNIVFRSNVISFLRTKMTSLGFLEIQTPILSASSPEGARDYLIPSRKHKGHFYALPQAPQIFKQLLMVSGFDKYFQIAPCFRDEDTRSDRSAEFYQLDFEMAFAVQDDVLAVAEEVLYDTFTKFSEKKVSKPPFKRISFEECMLKYGTDKPDLRNPLEICDISHLFIGSDFAPFRNRTVRSICVPNAASQSKTWFKKMEEFAFSIGMKGLGYVKVTEDLSFDGPIDKFLKDGDREKLIQINNAKQGDVIYFISAGKKTTPKLAGQIRTEIALRLGLIDTNKFEFCFIVDFPMYEIDEQTGQTIFTHNPFSMPQGGLKSLNEKNPSEILAYQYDIVCNGVELSSGAVRNHDLETMIKAFSIAGYTEEELKNKFTALYSAFQYGAPPHAGMAPGIDRILMLLKDEANIREVIAFPMNSNGQDVLSGAPSEVTEQQLRDVHIKVRN